MRYIQVILVLVASLSNYGCTSSVKELPEESPGVYVRIKEWRGWDIDGWDSIKYDSPLPKVVKDSVVRLSDDYFLVEIQSFSDGHFEGEKDLVSGQYYDHKKDHYSKKLYVTDSLGNTLKFESPTSFINFVSKRGYELTQQKELKFGFDYTFKKRD